MAEATNLQLQGMNRFATDSRLLLCFVLFQALCIWNRDVAFLCCMSGLTMLRSQHTHAHTHTHTNTYIRPHWIRQQLSASKSVIGLSFLHKPLQQIHVETHHIKTWTERSLWCTNCQIQIGSRAVLLLVALFVQYRDIYYANNKCMQPRMTQFSGIDPYPELVMALNHTAIAYTFWRPSRLDL